MALFIAESFDGYGVITDLTTGGKWTTYNSSINFADKGPFSVGQSIATSSAGAFLRKTGGPNKQTWFINCWYLTTNALSGTSAGWTLRLLDGTTVQCTIAFRSDGAIIIYSGTTAGTIIATFSSAFVANSFDHWQFKIIISDTVGEVHVRKNGATSDTFSATGLNTRGGTTNAYANGLQLVYATSLGGDYLDDVMMFDNDTGSGPYDWTGSVRAIQCVPTSDTAQKQFTLSSIGSLTAGQTGNTATFSLSANSLQTGNVWHTTQGGTFTTATVEFNAGFTGDAKIAVYASNGDNSFNSNAQGAPGTLLAVSNVVTNPTTGANVFTFGSSVPIANGRYYFFALLTDAACVVKRITGTTSGWSYATTYSGGFPSSLAGLATSSASRGLTIYATLTANNAGGYNDENEDGVTTYAYDNVVGDYDLADLEDLGYTPSSIVGVYLRSYVAKSDSSARGFKIAGKSGGTSFETSEYSPLTTFSNFDTFYPTDPNTGAAWTPTAVNALQIGPKVSS